MRTGLNSIRTSPRIWWRQPLYFACFHRSVARKPNITALLSIWHGTAGWWTTSFLRFLNITVGEWSTSSHWYWLIASRLISRARSRRWVHSSGPCRGQYNRTSFQMNILSWLLMKAKGEEATDSFISSRIFAIYFAAIHTTSMVRDFGACGIWIGTHIFPGLDTGLVLSGPSPRILETSSGWSPRGIGSRRMDEGRRWSDAEAR